MSLPDVRPQANLLSEFALATLSAFGVGLPIAVAIIWICSWSRCRLAQSDGEQFAATRNAR